MPRARFARLCRGTMIFAALLAFACQAEDAVVSGTAAYRERIALPPNAIFEAVLEDVSRPGAPAEQIGSTKLDPAGNPPFSFSIRYAPGKILAHHTYSVRARISVDDKLLLTTDALKPVITRGQPQSVELLLHQIGSKIPVADATLSNTYWKLIRLGDTRVPTAPGQREISLNLRTQPDPAVSGFSGCNRFMGSYTLNDSSLSFGALASTRMACGAAMETEREFLDALGKVRHWAISSQRLNLSDEQGKVLIKMHAVHLR